MKRLIILILCVSITALAFSGCGNLSSSNEVNQDSPYTSQDISQKVVDRNSKFTFEIFKQLNKEDKDKNIFISPLSISTALSMVYQGAGTTTKDAMAKALGYQGVDISELNRSYQNLLRYLGQADSKATLDISNSIWIRDGVKVQDNFISVNKDIFSAEINLLDFSKSDSADKINSWIYDSTKGKIDKMIDAPIPANIIMYLINAIYFKGDWTTQFDSKDTFNTQFHKSDGGTNNINMMSRTGKLEYGEVDGTRIVRLPYGKGKIAMYGILPAKDKSIDSLVKDMDLDKWTALRKSISEREDIQLQIPKFKMEYGQKELNDTLISLGMGEAFSDTADFSGIREGIAISRVLHKAVIEVNEEGSEAAAVTVVEVKETAAVLDPPSFIADRPFIFMIADDSTGSILFMGKAADIAM